MQYSNLGRTELKISKIGLGTMTWGEQNTEKEAFEQLDYALSQGINFIDTAELYSVPSHQDTYGSTEKIIGNWISVRKNRDKFILATKASGPGPKHIRQGPKFNRQHLTQSIDNSLSRLQTDCIDLYQLHWPERKTNFFGKLGYVYNNEDKWRDNFQEILSILNEFIQQGKIRYIGISNETPWGTMKYLSVSEQNSLPRIVSIQNPYNLLNRTFEIGLAEISLREKVSLLAYSPLAFGLLTGKYFTGESVDKSRITLFSQLSRYNSEISKKAAENYYQLATKCQLSSAQMSLAFVNLQPFVACNIIGATTLAQLKENIESIHVQLSTEVIQQIEEIHKKFPNPAP